MIFYDGDPAQSFYVVGKGRVKVFKTSPDGKEQILMIAAPGDSFAEAAMFAGSKFPASAQAIEDSDLIRFDRDQFLGLLGRNPDLALSLIGRLAHLLRKLTKLIESLSLTDVTTRLASFLREQSKLRGTAETVVHLPIKKTTLAAQLGTIPETLSRSFAKLANDGIIEVSGPDIRILDPNRLSDLCTGD